MATEVKMTLANLKRGGEAFAVKATITSIDKPIEHMQRDRREYYERYRKYTRQSGVADASEIQVYINSQGGRVDSAIGITTALCMYKKPMRILIDGSCCSAATLLLELPAPVYITPSSRIYLHSPMRMRYKRDKDGVFRMVQTEKYGMRLVTAYMVEAVRIRGKQTKHRIRKRTIREWIRNGTWFTAEEAVAAGLCDGIMSRTDFERGD